MNERLLYRKLAVALGAVTILFGAMAWATIRVEGTTPIAYGLAAVAGVAALCLIWALIQWRAITAVIIALALITGTAIGARLDDTSHAHTVNCGPPPAQPETTRNAQQWLEYRLCESMMIQHTLWHMRNDAQIRFARNAYFGISPQHICATASKLPLPSARLLCYVK